MRKINTQDAFKTARIIKHSNVKEVIFKYYDDGELMPNASDKDIERFGMNLFFDAIACLSETRAEEEFYDLLAGICEKTVEDIKSMEITETIEVLKQIATENDLKSFFRFVSAMTSNT